MRKYLFEFTCISFIFIMLMACSTNSSSQQEESESSSKLEESSEQTTQAYVYEIEKIEIITEDGVTENNTWIVGKGTSMKFTINGDSTKFKYVEIDEKVLYLQYYTKEDNDTNICVLANYLDDYSLVGEHTLHVQYEDGEAEIKFYVELEVLPPMEGYYEYPVTPEDEEWKEMTQVERREACKIPQNILDSMNDEQLIHAVLDYPFLVNVDLFLSGNTCIEGRVCAAFDELIARESGKDSCITFIKENYLSNETNELDVKKEYFITLVRYDMYMMQKLTEEDIEIIREAVDEEWIFDY